jgi:hypothetical protein
MPGPGGLRGKPARHDLISERARATVERLPRVYLRVARRRTPRRDAVGDATDVLIEGFPRSGNSFLVAWLRRANPDLQIASHMHSIAHVRAALRRDVPVVVVIRPPEAALASWSVYNPRGAVDVQIERYRRFHEGLAEVADHVLISPFEVTTESPTTVVHALEAPLRRSLVDEPPGGMDEVFDEVDRRSVAYGSGHDERRLGRPTESRRAETAVVRRWLRDHRHGEMARLGELHDRLAGLPTAITPPTSEPARAGD